MKEPSHRFAAGVICWCHKNELECYLVAQWVGPLATSGKAKKDPNRGSSLSTALPYLGAIADELFRRRRA
jgi:hypothetical protein